MAVENWILDVKLYDFEDLTGDRVVSLRRAVAAARAQASKLNAPLPCLNREAGLAAVAAELHLQVSTLEFEVAEAVEKGAAALFLAGFGPRLVKRRRVRDALRQAFGTSAKN